MLEKLKQFEIKNAQMINGGSSTQIHQIRQETQTK